MDRGAWWATVHEVAKSQTRLSDSAQHCVLCTIYIHYLEEFFKPPSDIGLSYLF